MTAPFINFWAPLTKVESHDDGTCTVFGLLTDAGLDRDKQGMNQDWLDQAVPQWYGEGANIREMHPQGTVAAGIGVGLTRADDGGWWLASRIIDPIAVKKCLPGPKTPEYPGGTPPIYKGYSIGIRDYILDMTKTDRPNGEVVGGYISEASLADRPSNPRTLFTMVKNEGPGQWDILEEPVERELPEETDPPVDPSGDDLDKYVSSAQRKQYASQGVAMANGDFPIPDRGHLTAAIGRLKNYKGNKAAARQHIKKRARALGVKVPNLGKTLDLVASTAALRKYDEAADIAGGQDAIACIARLIQSEAAALATGRFDEMRDITLLLEAARSLEMFIYREQCQAEMGSDDSETDQTSEAVSPGAALYYMDQPGLVKINRKDAAVGDVDGKKKLTKTDGGDGAPADLAGMIGAAVTEALGPLKSELALAKADLAKVMSQPQAGGPVQTRTATQTGTARASEIGEIKKNIETLRQTAERIGNNDPALAQGYRDEADSLERRITKTY